MSLSQAGGQREIRYASLKPMAPWHFLGLCAASTMFGLAAPQGSLPTELRWDVDKLALHVLSTESDLEGRHRHSPGTIERRWAEECTRRRRRRGA